MLDFVEIEGVTGERQSALAVVEGDGPYPVILVHGIMDNLRRWITQREALQRALVLPEPRGSLPLFDCDHLRSGRFGNLPRLLEGAGLLPRLAEEEIPAVAYSYQKPFDLPVAPMEDAIAKLHRTILWALERWGAQRVILVGHSRGGLVCRHALLYDSPVMPARRARRLVDRSIAIATPHRGSRFANLSTTVGQNFGRFERLFTLLESFRSTRRSRFLDWFARFQALTANFSLLAPGSEEVSRAKSSDLPTLPGGYYAIAGCSATYFRCEVPVIGKLRLPPTGTIPEFIDGQGDMAVSLESALDIPDPSPHRTRIRPYNHETITFSPRVHDTLVHWIRG
ncbi:PGAP1-like protein [Planctomycetes bacterium Pan216]|uniref:PGAP1-like protein n=1 Tax=Kolteria novifilia TaxID=2527975 RepID=A0A518AYL3_9BACT|nr:PGAP1-like protein [Planctomycetes bacterium Pan216]